LNSLENRVYDLELEDKTHVIVKYYRPLRWSKAQIMEEHEFLFDLKSAEIPVCAPLLFNDKSSLKEIENIHYAVWERTGGRCVDEFSEDQSASLGRLLGRIHSVGKTKDAQARLKLTSENLVLKPLKYLHEKNVIPAKFETEYTKTAEKICAVFDELSQDVPYHRIHGDCHIGNLLFGNSGFFFLDFDDFYSGPAVQDFWMLFSNNDQEGIKNLNILLDNYRLFCDFDEKRLNLIEPLRALRFIHYSGWIAKRWDDPSFKNAFPHFGTPDYWMHALNDLTEQLKIIEKTNYIIQKNQDEVSTVEADPELSNKDFFWDWDEKKDLKK